MKKASLLTKAATTGAVITLGATVWVAGRARAFNPQPDPPGFSGLVGIVEGQTARLSVVNVTTQPMQAALVFRDGDGSVVKRSLVTLRPGQGASLDLTRRELSDTGAAATGAGQAEVYGEYVLLPAVQRAFPPGPCRPTLEVFGADGSTTVLDTNFHNPPGDHNAPSD